MSLMRQKVFASPAAWYRDLSLTLLLQGPKCYTKPTELLQDSRPTLSVSADPGPRTGRLP